MTAAFEPDWVVAPGETLMDWLEEVPLPLSTQGRVLQISPEDLDRLKTGDLAIDDALAHRLEALTFVPARVWLALEHNYRVGLAASRKRI